MLIEIEAVCLLNFVSSLYTVLYRARGHKGFMYLCAALKHCQAASNSFETPPRRRTERERKGKRGKWREKALARETKSDNRNTKVTMVA